MKRFMIVVLVASLMVFAISYSHAEGIEDLAVDPAESELNTDDAGCVTDKINPPGLSYNVDDYDVVIVDQDRWRIMMNLSRVRDHCTSYTGCLYFEFGANIFWGHLTAAYDHRLDMVSITAFDAGWYFGHIQYALQFIEGTNDLYGNFVYYEFPRRTNGIYAWLEKGQLGPHIGPW